MNIILSFVHIHLALLHGEMCGLRNGTPCSVLNRPINLFICYFRHRRNLFSYLFCFHQQAKSQAFKSFALCFIHYLLIRKWALCCGFILYVTWQNVLKILLKNSLDCNSSIFRKREVEQPEIKWEVEWGSMFLQSQSFAGIPLLTGVLV